MICPCWIVRFKLPNDDRECYLDKEGGMQGTPHLFMSELEAKLALDEFVPSAVRPYWEVVICRVDLWRI